MRRQRWKLMACWSLTASACLFMQTSAVSAQQPEPRTVPQESVTPPAPNDGVKEVAPAKGQYHEFSRFLHGMVLKNLPKVVEDDSGWGGSVPIEPNLRLGFLRKRIKVGDRFEFPDGLWKRSRVWVQDPKEDIIVDVREFKKKDAKTYYLAVDSQAIMHGQAEVRFWRKGLPVVQGVFVNADAVMACHLEFDVGVSIRSKGFIPEIALDPKLTTCKLYLQDFKLRDVDTRRLGLVLTGQPAIDVGNDIKGLLQSVITTYEPQIQAQANDAIAQGIQEGKGTISATALLQIFNSASPGNAN